MRPEEYNMMVEKLAEEIVEDVLQKEAGAWQDDFVARRAAAVANAAQTGGSRNDAFNDVSKANRAANQAARKARVESVIREKNPVASKSNALKSAIEFAKKHPKGVGIGGGALAATGLAATGLAAYKHHKKKKEEQKEKVAAYYEDALLMKQAAEEAWAFANQYEDSMAVNFIKQAAEEAYEEAEAQAEAAENVFAAIENNELCEDYE